MQAQLIFGFFVFNCRSLVSSCCCGLVGDDGSLVSGLSVFVNLGYTFVLDVSAVSVVVSDVSDDLSSTVGQEDAVGTGDVTLVVALLLMGVIVVVVIVFDSIGERVRLRGLYNIKEILELIADY